MQGLLVVFFAVGYKLTENWDEIQGVCFTYEVSEKPTVIAHASWAISLGYVYIAQLTHALSWVLGS